MLAPPDWYPWRCEGGNINTTAHKSSLRSRLDGCSQAEALADVCSRTKKRSKKDFVTRPPRRCCGALLPGLSRSFGGTVIRVSAGKQGGGR